MKEKPKKALKKVLPRPRTLKKREILAPVEVTPVELAPVAEEKTPDAGVQVHRWTREEYYHLAEIGLFDGRRVELIEGEIYEMSPMATPHATSMRQTLYARIEAVRGQDCFVDTQLPMTMADGTEPEPDVAVIAGATRDYRHAHPTTALLLVEVSDTTLRYDRRIKAPLYAAAKVAEYWILNLQDRQLEVRRNPAPDAASRTGFGYRSLTIYDETESVAPLCAPSETIALSELLP